MIERIQNTERHILTLAGTTVDHGDYLVTRSARYPKWYQANMLELRTSGGRSLADWEQVFYSHFDRAAYRHLMLYIPEHAGFEDLHNEVNEIMSTDNRGTPPLLVERIAWMFAMPRCLLVWKCARLSQRKTIRTSSSSGLKNPPKSRGSRAGMKSEHSFDPVVR